MSAQILPYKNPASKQLTQHKVVRWAAGLSHSRRQSLILALLALNSAEGFSVDKTDCDRAPEKASNSQHQGHYEEKIINGCGPYRYLRYWERGKHCSVYLGKVQE